MESPRRSLPFYVIGHRNPDTDAICSAIGNAALLRATGEPAAIAARCGDVPARTAWVLEQAGIETPPLVMDVRATAGMICRRDVVQVAPTDTFLVAYRRMLASGVRCVPVVDADGHVHGILRYLDLLELLVPGDASGIHARTVSVSLSKIAVTLQAESVGAEMPLGDDEEELILLVGASSQSTVERRLKLAAKEGNVNRFFVICGDRPVVQHYAIENGARALLVTGGNGVEPALRDLAKKRGVVVLLCSQDTASSSTLIRCSRTVRHVMDKDFINIAGNEPVSRLRKSLAPLEQDLFPVEDAITKEMVGVLSKSDLIDPPRTRLALVDHNEFAQAVTGVEESEIVEVIDHHRLAGDLVSREPIRFLNEPVGSTSTLVARKFRHRYLEPDRGTALCLCAGIIADTLCLTSPTTAELDHEMLGWLSELAGIDPASFKKDFFAVGSLLATGTPDAILNADRKEFVDEGVKVTIAQVEELGLQGFAPRREELETALKALVKENGYELAVLVVTDIAEHHSLVLAAGEPSFVANIPYAKIDASLYDAPGVVSRKKQIFPAVCQALRRAN
ncbi:putative manganese-dependent inorganic diphosphatase [Luteolibacter sp. GHJ8]|jgi:manganese-dependent inorganic pyrophosphatase|uniref:inorganic diphosphatase n=1 Tax=Luteolibacter rhizosphaerae TaxID=2989719 RepID=A0ABT3G373_9BACT|nr:putative manganese-dependent inorganic diphosphatase [Luteolibacter rhizosphaerae]MCW1913934.1 putative manganese-dependent inorganic diphosphatase [Luteolibacter rhizosphaerae]